MSVLPQQIGPYQVVREIGRGGMGVVYLGHDGRLDRPVAIKFLPDALAHDPERIARLTREARTLATVNHSGVAAIYGIEESPAPDGAPGGASRSVLILEYVPGQTLGERLTGGALPVEDALSICAQVASAVEAAHERGVIHRDLKPDNIKITPEGAVKVLDFGLAKAERAGSSTSMDATVRADSPAAVASRIGEVMGTPGYMSPEQCRGRTLDKRTDIWSLGCILYECLCGVGPFQGETSNDAIAAILEREPDWTRLPSRTPPRIRELLAKCLAKDARSRLRDVGDAKLELERSLSAREWSGIASFPPGMLPPTSARWREPARLIGACVAGVALTSIGWLFLRGSPARDAVVDPPGPVMRLSVDAPPNMVLLACSLSPDGRTIYLFGDERSPTGEATTFNAYARNLDSFALTQLPSSVDIEDLCFSPDGRWYAMLAPVSRGAGRQRIVRGPIDGSSPPVTVAELPIGSHGDCLAWPVGDDLLVLQRGLHSLVRVGVNSGAISEPVAFATPSANAVVKWLWPLPDGRRFLASYSAYGERGFDQNVGILNLDEGQVTLLIPNAGAAHYVETGHVLFSRSDALLAVPFDLASTKVTGPPQVLVTGLRTLDNWSNAPFDISRNGTLTYLPGGVQGAHRTLVTVGIDGKAETWFPEHRAFTFVVPPCMSPDGLRAAAVVTNANGIDEIWIAEPAGKQMRRLVALPHADAAPLGWMPDGERLIFGRLGEPASDDGVYMVRIDGSEPPALIASGQGRKLRHEVGSPLPDGSAVIVDMQIEGHSDLLLVPIPGASGPAAPATHRTLIHGATILPGAAVSPDGKLLAYSTTDSEVEQVFVCTFSSDGQLGPRIPASSEGGHGPRWRTGDGGKLELLYVDPRGRGMSVPVIREPRLRLDSPVLIADGSHANLGLATNCELLADGRLFAVQGGEEEVLPTSACLVLNFLEELKLKMNAAKSGH